MPRTARLAPKKQVFHLLIRGNGRKAIFKHERDYQRYIEILDKYKQQYKFKLYHYVLMKNHVHLVLETTEEGGGIAQIMKGINLSYAQYYKYAYKHKGHFWRDRYKSILVSNDHHLLTCGIYVELNPVRKKISSEPKDYLWSSFNFYAYGSNGSIIDENPVYTSLSHSTQKRREKYRKFIQDMISKKNALKGEMNRRLVYGNEEFINEIKKNYHIEEKTKPKGRPKKKTKTGKKNKPLATSGPGV